MTDVQLTASHFTLTGAGFGQPARHSLDQRLDAAATAGFTGIGLHVDEAAQFLAAGHDLDDLGRLVSDYNLSVVELEFLSGWARGNDLESVSRTIGLAHALATVFGSHHLSGGEFAPSDDELDVPSAGAQLARAAALLEPVGLSIALEAFAWSPLPDLPTALAVLEAAEAPNTGLLVDVWHFFNSGATLAELAALPGSAVAAVQLNDGPHVHDDFLTQARATRWLPGHGHLDVVGLIRTLDEIGYPGPYCVEVNYPEFRELSAHEAARQAFEAAREALHRARS